MLLAVTTRTTSPTRWSANRSAERCWLKVRLIQGLASADASRLEFFFAASDQACSLSPWTEWSECSVTCGPNGIRRRSRTLLSHSNANDGYRCRSLPLEETQPCHLHRCRTYTRCSLLLVNCSIFSSGRLCGQSVERLVGVHWLRPRSRADTHARARASSAQRRQTLRTAEGDPLLPNNCTVLEQTSMDKTSVGAIRRVERLATLSTPHPFFFCAVCIFRKISVFN